MTSMSNDDSTAPPKLDYFTPGFEPVYAGFWLRFSAMAIDGIVVAAICSAIGLGTMELVPITPSLERLGSLGFWVGLWLYHSLMESASWGATVGKAAVGIRVTDMNGARISFGRATARFAGKLMSTFPILGAGFLFAGVTHQNQALHDNIASTLVVKGRHRES